MGPESMLQRMTRLVWVCAVSLSASALAIGPGGSLYLSCKDVKLLKDPKAGAKTVGAALKEGDEVKWLGASEKNKSFHQVEAAGKKGFVLQSCLKPNKPMSELVGEQKVSAQAFASSGAATKGYPPMTPYAGSSPAEKDAAAQLAKLEELNKNITAAELAAKEKELAGGK